MSRVILQELQTVGIAFLSGALITIVYDVFRIFRRAVPHGNFWIGVEDLIFWIWTALWTFSVLYRENDGNLRMYTMIAMASGMICYHLTISEALVGILGKLLKKLLQLLMYPLKLLKKYIIFFGKKLKKIAAGIIMKIIHNRQVCAREDIDGKRGEANEKRTK